MGLTAAELTSMRRIADDFLPDTCTIQMRSGSVDATGGLVWTYANTYTAIPCRLAGGSGGEAVVNEALEGQSVWTLTLAHDQAIGIQDRVVHAGLTYEVINVNADQSYLTVKRVGLARVN